MRPDPASLRVFVAVVELGSIAAAAQREHLAAAAISRRIAELEQALGSPLLVRNARGIRPTAAGLSLMGLARGALHALDEIPLQMQDFATGLRGQVRVFANISAITQFLPADLARFRQAYPEVRVVLEESNSAATVQAVADNAADIGVFTDYPHGGRVQSLPYRRDRLCLVIPSRHRLARRRTASLREVLQEDFVGLRTGSAVNLLLSAEAARLGSALRVRIQVTGFDALCLMVSQGFGIGVAPQGITQLYAASLGVRELKLADAWAARELRLAVRSPDMLPPAARRLLEHLQATGG